MDFPESKPLVEEPEENFSDIPIIVPCLPNQGGVSPPQTPKNLFDEIRKNIYSCDLILCFFISALQSYKTDHCLRPFPPFYIHKHEKDFNLLVSVIIFVKFLNDDYFIFREILVIVFPDLN